MPRDSSLRCLFSGYSAKVRARIRPDPTRTCSTVGQFSDTTQKHADSDTGAGLGHAGMSSATLHPDRRPNIVTSHAINKHRRLARSYTLRSHPGVLGFWVSGLWP